MLYYIIINSIYCLYTYVMNIQKIFLLNYFPSSLDMLLASGTKLHFHPLRSMAKEAKIGEGDCHIPLNFLNRRF